MAVVRGQGHISGKTGKEGQGGATVLQQGDTHPSDHMTPADFLCPSWSLVCGVFERSRGEESVNFSEKGMEETSHVYAGRGNDVRCTMKMW